MEGFRHVTNAIDDKLGRSTFGRIFRLEGCGHEKEIAKARFLTEVRAGITTFFTMAYIISVNASILTDSGGPCVCTDLTDPTCATNTEYNLCLLDVKRDLVTATAAISGLASILFGFMTNLPVALAPGMGLNAYFAYQVVGFHGTGNISYGLALAAIFIEGLIFMFLALTGMRVWLVRVLPNSIKIASGCGIGLFLSIVGLSYSSGIGIVTGGGTATVTTLAGCPEQYLNAMTGQCDSHTMTSPTMWIGLLCGGVLTAWLMSYKVKSAIIIGIAVVSILSWPRPTSFTYFPHNDIGDARFDFFKRVVDVRPLKYTLNAVDWNVMAAPQHFALALFTFLYVDIIDCTATLYSMARFSGNVDPKTADFPRSTIAYCIDSLCISIGAILGTSPVTAYIESGAGIAEGGKTGLTAMTTGVCFLLSLFFSPIFASIPPWATGCTLVLVGCMMIRQVTLINWRYIGDAVPAFVTLFFMPFSYSIAYGLIAGLLVYTVLNGLIWVTRLASGGRIVPDDEDQKEYWTWRPQGTRPWFVRVCQDPKSVFSGGEVDTGVREITSTHSSYEEVKMAHLSSNGVEKSQPDIQTVAGPEQSDESRMPYVPRPTFDRNGRQPSR